MCKLKEIKLPYLHFTIEDFNKLLLWCKLTSLQSGTAFVAHEGVDKQDATEFGCAEVDGNACVGGDDPSCGDNIDSEDIGTPDLVGRIIESFACGRGPGFIRLWSFSAKSNILKWISFIWVFTKQWKKYIN